MRPPKVCRGRPSTPWVRFFLSLLDSLDWTGATHQPVHGVVELVLIHLAQAQFLAQGGVLGAGLQALGQGQLAGRLQDPARHQGQGEFPLPVPATVKKLVHFQGADHGQHRGDMTVGQRRHHLGLSAGSQVPALEQDSQGLDPFRGPVAEVSPSAVFDLAFLTEAFPQKDRGRRIPIRDDCDLHTPSISAPIGASIVFT